MTIEEFKAERKGVERELNRLFNQMHNMFGQMDALEKQRDHAREALAEMPKTPCELCAYNPPTAMDGKPCTVCPAVRRWEE